MADFQQGLSGTDQYGRTLATQTDEALRLPGLVTNPNFSPYGQSDPVGTKRYIDKYGRVAVGKIGADGNIILNQTMGPPKPPVVQPPPPISQITQPPAITQPPTPPNSSTPPLTNLQPPPVIPTPDASTMLDLSTLGGAVGTVRLASGLYGLAQSGDYAVMANGGVLGGINNAIDQFGANYIPGFTTYGNVPGWTWNQATQFYELTDPAAAAAGNVGYTSLSSAIGYGNVGSFVANLFGLTTGSVLGDLAAGTIGGIAGGAIGGSIGGTLLGMSAGAVGAFVGGFAITALASMFGPRESDMLSGAMYNSSTQSIDKTWTYSGNKHSAANDAQRDAFMGYIKDMQNGLATTFGIKASDIDVGKVRLDIGRWTGFAVNVGDQVGYGDQDTGKDMKNGLTAFDYVGVQMLQKMKGVSQDVDYVRQNLDWSKQSFNSGSAAMTFANDFQKVSTAFLTGNFKIDQTKDGSMQTIDTWASQAKNLFAGKDQDKYYAQVDRAVTAAKATVFDYFQKNPENPQKTT